jgi:hypothetical protein
MQVANTILAQLGGNKFLAMTGAHSLVGSECAATRDGGLHFTLPRGATNGATKVMITLNKNDTYDVRFFKVRKHMPVAISTHNDVQADNLRDLFERATGLRTSL